MLRGAGDSLTWTFLDFEDLSRFHHRKIPFFFGKPWEKPFVLDLREINIIHKYSIVFKIVFGFVGPLARRDSCQGATKTLQEDRKIQRRRHLEEHPHGGWRASAAAAYLSLSWTNKWAKNMSTMLVSLGNLGFLNNVKESQFFFCFFRFFFMIYFFIFQNIFWMVWYASRHWCIYIFFAK